MRNLIHDGPPVVNAVTHTDKPGIEVRTPCLVDGYAAEIHHRIDTKHQEYNRHTLSVFDARTLMWSDIMNWGYAEGGHIPIHPDAETVGSLRGLSELMWSIANVFTAQSRLRSEDLDTRQYVAERVALQTEIDALELGEEPYSQVDHGQMYSDEVAAANAPRDLRTDIEREADAQSNTTREN